MASRSSSYFDPLESIHRLKWVLVIAAILLLGNVIAVVYW